MIPSASPVRLATAVGPGYSVVLLPTVLVQFDQGYSGLLFLTVQVQYGSGSAGILGGTCLGSRVLGQFSSDAGGVYLPPQGGPLTSWSDYQA
jgi:hypothetical protein